MVWEFVGVESLEAEAVVFCDDSEEALFVDALGEQDFEESFSRALAEYFFGGVELGDVGDACAEEGVAQLGVSEG